VNDSGINAPIGGGGPITLYYRPGTCALAPRIALEEAGAEYRVIDVSNDRDHLVTVNARGKVPVLEVGGTILRENVAILYFIASAFPDAGLLPVDLMERAQCISVAAWFASTLHIDYRRVVKPFVFGTDPAAHDDIRDQGRLAYVQDLEELDRHLDGKTWIVGARPSVADFYGLVFIEWALTSKLYNPGWRNIEGWKDRLLQRPGIRKVIAETGSLPLGVLPAGTVP
jgi:glutathione S-transferase